MIRRLRAAAGGWVEDQASQMGAALAYYTLFSLAPLLLLAMLILGVVLGEAESKAQLNKQLDQFLSKEGMEAASALLDSFQNSHARTGASILGLLSLLVGASGMFTSLRSSLQRVWRLPPRRESILVGVVKTYLLAFLMVGLTCAFVLTLLLLSAALPLVVPRLGELIPDVPWSSACVDLLGSTLLLTILFTFSYRFMADGRIAYGKLVGGAFTAALLFTVGKLLIGLYLAYTNLASAYGAAGSVVVFLAWVYYSAQIVFFGAEVVRFGLPGAREGGAGVSGSTGP